MFYLVKFENIVIYNLSASKYDIFHVKHFLTALTALAVLLFNKSAASAVRAVKKKFKHLYDNAC